MPVEANNYFNDHRANRLKLRNTKLGCNDISREVQMYVNAVDWTWIGFTDRHLIHSDVMRETKPNFHS